MALALDEPTEQDEKNEVGGYTILVDKDLMEKAKPIKIDMSYMGFQITSNLQLGGGGGCGGSCSSGSCS